MGMFDDLVPSAEASAPAPKGGGMFDDLVPARGPIASQFSGPDMSENFGGAPLPPDAAPPPEAPANAFAPPESVMPAPSSIADRFKPMVSEAFHGGSVGALTDRINSGQVDQQGADQAFRAIVEARQAGSQVALRNFNPTPEEQKLYANNPSVLANPFVGVPLPELEAKFNALSQSAGGKREVYDAERDERKRKFEELPGTFDAPTLGGKVANAAIDATGMLIGGAANPENLIGGGGGRAVKMAGESAVKYAIKEGAKDLGRGATGGALGGAIANPAVQAGEISRGEREGYSPEETVANAVLGGAVGTAFHLPGVIARPVMERIAARRGVPVDKLDPDHVSQTEVAETFKDPEIAALAKANGIESPTDPRVAVLEDKLANRKGEEALRTPDQPVQSLKAQDAEVGRRQGEVSGVKDETIDPAATNIIKRTPDETPIRVDSEGNAFRADAGALEGKAKAEALQRADMKLLPAPDRLPYETPTDEGANVQHRGTQGDRPHGGYEDVTPEPPPKLYGGENRLPEAADGKPIVDYANQKTSTKAAPVDESGKFATDQNGYVASDKGGPVRFAQEKQAERFVASQGKKTGQDFDVVEHPAGKGFTVQERAPEAEAQRQITDQRQPPPAADSGPRQIEDNRSYDQRVRDERDRLWADDMKGYAKEGKPIKQEGGGELASQAVANHRMVEASARETVMRREAAEQVARAEQTHGIPQESIHEVAQLYRRGENETTQQAWERAVDRWGEKNENAALDHLHTLDEADRNFDTLKSEAGVDTLYTDNHEAIHGPEVDHEAIPFDSSDHEGPQRDGQPVSGHRESGADGENGREAAGAQARSEGGGTRGQAGSERETASGHTDAGPDGKRQTVIPGAERLTDRALAERQGGKPLRGGDEPPPKGGLFDEDARNQKDMFDPRSTTHAGAIFDPAVWKWFGSKIAGDKYLREMSALAKDIKEDKADTRGRKTNRAADAARFVFYSVDGQMRALADAVKSPTLKKIADLFYAPADVGRGGAVGQTYHEAVTARSGRNLNKLSEIMEKLGDKPAAFDQVVKLVQNPRNIKPGTVIHDAAAAITKLLNEEHDYIKGAGIDVGKVVGYYPREINVASVMKNGDGFRLAAERAYKASGLGAQEAKEAAEQWLSRVVLGGVNIRPEGTDFVHMGGTPASKFSKGRELSKAADEIMAPFYHRDPLEALTTYFQRTARRAEWARRMGDYVKGPDGKPVFDELGAWKKMKAEMIKEGNAAAVRQTVDMIASSTGANSATLPMGADALVGVLKAYGTVKLLTHAAITSASESVLPAIRAGAPHRILTDIPRTVAALFAKSGKLGEQREFAEDLGLIMRGAANGILAARYSAMDPTSRVRERIMNRNFRMSGLEQWTSATRVMAVNGAETFVRRLALDVADGRLRQASSRNLLKEMGVQDTAGFAKWVKENSGDKMGRDVTSGGFSDVYRNAVTRFVHQSIMEVSASTRPQWANNPVGSLIFMLQSYNYAYQKNVTSRAYHQVASAVTGKGMNLADRATMLSPLALIPAMFAIQMGLAPVRNAVFNSSHNKQMSDEDQLVHNMTQAASRSVTGAFDPVVNLFTSAKYHSSSENTLGGPVLAGLGQLIDAVVAMTPKDAGGPNSPKTNAAERNLTRNIYDSAVAPAIVTAGALSPSWLGAILTQAPSLGPVKDAVIDSVAGAPTKQGASGRPQRPTRK